MNRKDWHLAIHFGRIERGETDMSADEARLIAYIAEQTEQIESEMSEKYSADNVDGAKTAFALLLTTLMSYKDASSQAA
jgi:hypothetical protein